MWGCGLSIEPKPVRTGHLLASSVEEGDTLLPWPSFVGTLPFLRPGSLWLALQPESPEPGDTEGGKHSVMRRVNKAVHQSGTVKGSEDTLKGSCNTAAILGRTVTANTWGHKGQDAGNLRCLLQAEFMVATEPLPQRLKAHRHQLPYAPKVRSHGSTVAEMPTQSSASSCALAQAFKFQLLEG